MDRFETIRKNRISKPMKLAFLTNVKLSSYLKRKFQFIASMDKNEIT